MSRRPLSASTPAELGTHREADRERSPDDGHYDHAFCRCEDGDGERGDPHADREDNVRHARDDRAARDLGFSEVRSVTCHVACHGPVAHRAGRTGRFTTLGLRARATGIQIAAHDVRGATRQTRHTALPRQRPVRPPRVQERDPAARVGARRVRHARARLAAFVRATGLPAAPLEFHVVATIDRDDQFDAGGPDLRLADRTRSQSSRERP